MTSTSLNQMTYSDSQILNQDAESDFSMMDTEIESILSFCSQQSESDSDRLIKSLLGDAINKRFQTGKIHEHIYLKNDEVSQIQLFNILIEKFPFVKYSQLITNNAIIETIGTATEASIIDIGIGQGAQILHVIELARKLPNLKKLRIIGIEPFLDALQKATININACKENVPFEIEFTGIHGFIEAFDFGSLQNLPGTLIVNASLALHHIQQQQKREEVIAAIKKLSPAAFILIEPNVDHFEKNLPIRFMNCYHHYYNIFKVIDRLDIDQKDKTSLKLFFGREIEDVIGKAETDRYEKHEKAIAWIERLERNGFTLQSSQLTSPVKSAVGVDIAYHTEGFLGFTNETETVLAVMYAN